MTAIIVGIIILVVGFIATTSNEPLLRKNVTLIKIAGVVVLLIGISVASVKQIEPGEVGVQKLFGKVNNNILESGLNVVNPLVQVVTFDIRTENYTMSGILDEGTKQGDDAIRVLTADGLEVVVDLTVLYKVIPSEAPRLLKEVGIDYRNVLVRPICRTKIRDNAVYYDAVSLYSTKRDEFQSRIFSTIESNFKERGSDCSNSFLSEILLFLLL